MNNKEIKIYRSPLFYVGDKYKLLPKISKYFPDDIERFIEPFTGGGSVFLNIKAEQYLLNDIDQNVVNIHSYLVKQSENPELFLKQVKKVIKKYGLSRSYEEDIVPSELKAQWKKTYYAKFNKEGFNKLKEKYNSTSKKDILELYVLLIYGFNRMLRFNKKGEYNLPVGNVDFNKNVLTSLQEYFSTTNKRDIRLFNLDFTDFLDSIDYQKNDFVYLDPPYLITFSEYNKLWNDENEQKLINFLEKLNEKNIKFAISNVTHYKGKTNKIFLEWSKKYHSYNIKSNYISYHDNTNKVFNEVLVTNFKKNDKSILKEKQGSKLKLLEIQS